MKDTGEPLIPTKEEDTALKSLRDRIVTSVDEETGLMSISVTAGGRELSAALSESLLDHFRRRVREIRTEKVRERLEFVRERFREAEEELESAEERLTQFLERNQNPTTATLQFRRDRLQRQVSFKEQLYSELQSQLTQTRLDLQRRQPVITVVEKPVAPRTRSAPNRTIIVLFSVLLGALFGIGGALVRGYVRGQQVENDKREKVREIQNRLLYESALGTMSYQIGIWGREGREKQSQSRDQD
jgi:uncharacterized protein involved in exopolysaccharide biosynthesis